MIIIGAGMAGLLAARMLPHHKPVIYEAQPKLPNNHSAVLRFRSGLVGDVLGIPFREVSMIKSVIPWTNPVADSLAYSAKNSGVYRSDRSVTAGMVSETRYIAPEDLVAQMAEGVNIKYNTRFEAFAADNGPVISTIPMPVLASMLSYPNAPYFRYSAGQTVRAHIAHCEAYVSLLVPDPKEKFSRISITGSEMIVEIPNTDPVNAADVIYRAAWYLGIENMHISAFEGPIRNQYNKIIPIDDDARKNFMFWATSQYNIYSLGRYATWRPGLLLDDLVKDIRLIESWIKRKSNYDVALHRR